LLNYLGQGALVLAAVNRTLMVGCLLLVLGFRSSTALGAAYGVAVTGTMTITTLLFYVIARHGWGWPWWRALGLTAAFLAIDLAFFTANALKIAHGGWVTVALAGSVYLVMSTWYRGSRLITAVLARRAEPLEAFLDTVDRYGRRA
jgi:KUP system potassium uptake protein